MKLPLYKRFILLGLLLFLSVSCKREILDFFEAIKDYGYRSVQPLSPKKNPVNDLFLGGYVYDGLPVIISKKDPTTYKIEFLSILLYKENAIIDAHATQIGPSTFLNLAMGDYYCFMRINLIMNEELHVDLLSSSLKPYVPQDKIKSWLISNQTETVYRYTENDEEQTMDVYYSFVFSKITVERAKSIQAERLRIARKELFEKCKTYEEYEELVKTYPSDEYTNLAVIALFNRCQTIEDYTEFANYFPKSDLVTNAEIKIAAIREEQRIATLMATDKLNFEKAISINTIDSYEEFADSSLTKIYRDSAKVRMSNLAAKITKDEVEWKWTNGDQTKALQLIYYKIDHIKKLDEVAWINDLLTLYTLKINDQPVSKKALAYMDKLVDKRVVGDDFLNLYISKGFVLWSLNELELCLRVFELKLTDSFSSGQTFIEMVKIKYEFYCSQGIVFPAQSSTWKRIKKLKID